MFPPDDVTCIIGYSYTSEMQTKKLKVNSNHKTHFINNVKHKCGILFNTMHKYHNRPITVVKLINSNYA